jgi:hypothetical protein
MQTTSIMKVKEYIVFSEAVETGINIGWNRAFKHVDLTDKQTELLHNLEDQIKESIYNAVTDQVCEYFEFKNNEET